MEEETPPPVKPPQQEQLSGVAVVIIISIGVQTIIILFIFAKRQIMRFTLRGRRGPHVSVGQGGEKVLRKEIDRRIEYAAHLRHEPRIDSCHKPEMTADAIRYRVEAVDRIQELDTLLGQYDPEFSRPPASNLRSFMILCLAGPLVGLEPKTIHKFCDLYDLARHSYKPFLEPELDLFNSSVQELQNQVLFNMKNKPLLIKKGTPVHRRAVNRPRRRILCLEARIGVEGIETVVVHTNSSTVLLSPQTLSATNSTFV